ncbi:MAG: HAD family hydrolase [candidate division Zixibacteria bacterium]|nr:HAD family hydrolase [candidate division Zixibacteria bacterium]
MEKLTPKAVIFDLGSTLIEYETIGWDELGIKCTISTRKFLVKKGYNIPDEKQYIEIFERIKNRYRDKAVKSLVEWTIPHVTEELMSDLGIKETDDQLIADIFDAYYKPVKEQLYVYDDTIDTLKKIRRTIPVMGLVSNTIFPEQAHLNELKRFGMTDYLDFKLFSSTFGLRKPHKDIFIKAANMAGLAPSECVYVGDRYVEDIEGPFGVGMPSILKVKNGREYPEDMPLAIRRIQTLSELEEHIDLE